MSLTRQKNVLTSSTSPHQIRKALKPESLVFPIRLGCHNKTKTAIWFDCHVKLPPTWYTAKREREASFCINSKHNVGSWREVIENHGLSLCWMISWKKKILSLVSIHWPLKSDSCSRRRKKASLTGKKVINERQSKRNIHQSTTSCWCFNSKSLNAVHMLSDDVQARRAREKRNFPLRDKISYLTK